ncbi:helix-turn-helix transcriptional regulator [Mycoplasmatota bacterium]|nr:helix-turn-helix transcriptional regulator [Mycoplasmatota bacterium]
MDSKELCVYIERIRNARKVSQELLTEDIVSLRQYRRYLNGTSDMPFDIFIKMIDKLGLKLSSVFTEMQKVHAEEYDYANRLYNYAVNYNYKSFDYLLNHKTFDVFIDRNNKLLYDFSLIIKKYYQKELSRDKTRELISGLIGYPKILKNEILTDIELLLLSFMIDVSNKPVQNKVVDRIFYIFKNKGIISGGNNRIIILIAAKLAKYFGIKEEFERVIDFCDIALQRNKAYKSYYLSEYFYYYKSLAYYRLKDLPSYEFSLKKCFNVLELDDNEMKMKKFEELINDDYNIDFKNYVIHRYLDEYSKK